MERFNPFASESSLADDPDPFSASPIIRQLSSGGQSSTSPNTTPTKATQTGPNRSAAEPQSPSRTSAGAGLGPRLPPIRQTSLALESKTTTPSASKYSTSFPDPFGDQDHLSASYDDDQEPAGREHSQTRPAPIITSRTTSSNVPQTTNRSNSVTFLNETTNNNDPLASASSSIRTPLGRQTSSGFSSFLSRATSVTSNSVTDRVSGAVGSVKSAVDSLSSSLQQASSGLGGSQVISGVGGGPADSSNSQQQQQQQQSAASYLAAKLSSATNQFTSSGQSGAQMPVICRQRVILIIDSLATVDWAQQFNQYRRLISGLSSTGGGGGAGSALSSFFASQFISSSSSAHNNDGSDLIEQVDFRNISVLANQSSATAAIYVTTSTGSTPNLSGSSGTFNLSSRQQQSAPTSSNVIKVIRPEYVVVRERSKDRLEHLKGVVKALSYSLVPMFEPYEIWDTFQDRQLIFGKLLRVQKSLGKEHFPLIPQIYCQTHQDLLHYIQSNKIILPCLIRTGHLGKGKIRIDDLQMLRDFSSIMATSGQSCTIEQHLEVKYDLVVQRLGTSLKLFRRCVQQAPKSSSASTSASETILNSHFDESFSPRHPYDASAFVASRQPAVRQTSLGGGVLSSLISSTTGQQQLQHQHQHQALNRRSSSLTGAGCYEKLSDVNSRYKAWVEAVSREFDNKLEALCIKIVVASNDREYIVGLRNCSMDFLGNQDNQDEDKRSFVELIISRINTILPKHSPASRESSLNQSSMEQQQALPQNHSQIRRASSGNNDGSKLSFKSSTTMPNNLIDKKTFSSQSEINSCASGGSSMLAASGSLGLRRNETSGALTGAHHGAYGQLGNRSKSVSINPHAPDNRESRSPGDLYSGFDESPKLMMSKSSPFYRSSERSDSFATTDAESGSAMSSQSSGFHQRQSSLGQSFFDQTSTAFSSFQKQSISFFKRLDARADQIGNTPPQSAKSDVAFDRDFGAPGGGGNISTFGASQSDRATTARAGTKSQSMDNSTLDHPNRSPRRETPPKPPPPQSVMNRQSSLAASTYSQRTNSSKRPLDATATPNTTRQNSTALQASESVESLEGSGALAAAPTSSSTLNGQLMNNRGRVIRQNSALSAFEPFDLKESFEKASVDTIPASEQTSRQLSANQSQQIREPSAGVSTSKIQQGHNYDAASLTSGDSNSTNETTTAEDTMNNLKKTFASIFGDKCE